MTKKNYIFQSQNGLILTQSINQECEDVIGISIPKWSDFNLMTSALMTK